MWANSPSSSLQQGLEETFVRLSLFVNALTSVVVTKQVPINTNISLCQTKPRFSQHCSRSHLRGGSYADNPSVSARAQANGRLREASGGRRPCCVRKRSTPLRFIPNLKYLFKVSVTVTYSQRREYPHFVGASLSLTSRSALCVHVY